MSKVLFHIVFVCFLTLFPLFAAEDIENSHSVGYVKKSSYTDSFSETFEQYFGSCFEWKKITQREAAANIWNSYDTWFDNQIVERVLQRMDNIGVRKLTSRQIDQIKDYLNPGRGTQRDQTSIGNTTEKSYSLKNDTNFIKFSLRTVSAAETFPEWTCYRYRVQMDAYLDISLWGSLD